MECMLSSPPKPTRVLLEPITFNTGASLPTSIQNDPLNVHDIIKEETGKHDVLSSGSLEGRLLEQALETVRSLPEICENVAVLQQTQFDELKRQQEILTLTVRKLKVEQERRQNMREEVDSVQRRIYLAQGDLLRAKTEVKQLMSDIKKWLATKSQVELQLTEKQAENDKVTSKFEECRQKMAHYKELVVEEAKNSETFKTLTHYKNIVDDLLEKKKSLDSDPVKVDQMLEGEYETKLQEEIEGSVKICNTLEKDINKVQEEVEKVQEEQRKVKKSTQVLRKRNAAQLTRLRKRLHEVQARNRHWQEEATRLRDKIGKIKK